MRTFILTTFIFIFFKVGFACNLKSFDFMENDINIWLGNHSKFSKSFKTGRCALDEVLGNLSNAERRSIANLIAKSYNLDTEQERNIDTYNY